MGQPIIDLADGNTQETYKYPKIVLMYGAWVNIPSYPSSSVVETYWSDGGTQ